ALGLTAETLKGFDLIDEIVPEPMGGAHRDPAGASSLLRPYLVRHLEALQGIEIGKLLERRYQRLRKMGRFGGD
ncbi:MAG TPA: acetyl-CoA carboxylase carboxyl transferase subunit alpha, partial [Candidatus Methylomirabilis sp.]